MTKPSTFSLLHQLALAVVVVLGVTACTTVSSAPAAPPPPTAAALSSPSDSNELLDAVLWVQTSAEYRALAVQAYTTGRRMLDAALADPSWSALPDQSAPDLPPAVVLDIDETTLDNSPYEARLIRDGGTFDAKSWSAWVDEKSADAIPGAVEFTRYARSRGVDVFFVSNRTVAEEPATRVNLARLGFPLDPVIDTVLTRGEQSAKPTSDKEERLRFVASTHRVVLLFGDALGDFVSTRSQSVSEYRAQADRYIGYWGTKWIVLPNPMYGGWEQQVTRSQPRPTQEEATRKKRDALNTATP